MTSYIAKVYDNFVLDNPKLVLIFLALLFAFFGYHTSNFRLDASADSLLLEDDLDLKIFRKIHERYPSSDLLVVTYTPTAELFTEKALEPLKRLREELKAVSIVDTVFTMLDAPLIKSSEKPLTEMVDDIPSLEQPGINRTKAKAELLNSPIYRELIISEDGGTTALLLGLVEDPIYNQLLKNY